MTTTSSSNSLRCIVPNTQFTITYTITATTVTATNYALVIVWEVIVAELNVEVLVNSRGIPE